MERFKDDAVAAFAYVFTDIMSLLSNIDFNKLKGICTLKVAEYPDGFAKQVQDATGMDEFFEVLSNPLYCSWINTRILRRIVLLVKIPEAFKLIENYENWLHPKKVSEVMHCFKSIHFKSEHTDKMIAKINANPTKLTVSQVVKYCQVLESNMCIPKESIAVMDCDTGCLIITFRIPLYSVLHAYEMAKNKPLILRQFHIQYLDFNQFPRVFAINTNADEKCAFLQSSDTSKCKSSSIHFVCVH